MTWTKLSDDYSDRDEMWELSDGAYRLHTSGLNRVMRMLTDGYIAESGVRRLLPTYKAKYLTELIEAGFWEAVEGGYVIRDSMEHQTTAAKVGHEREKNRERQNRWYSRNRPGGAGPEVRPNGVSKGVTHGASNGPPIQSPPIRSEVPIEKPVRGAGSEPDPWARLSSEWEPFREPWEARGFRLPPTEKQREVLWPIVRDQPKRVGRWVAGAADGAKAADVVGHVIKSYREVVELQQADAARREAEGERFKAEERLAAPTALGDVMARAHEGGQR